MEKSKDYTIQNFLGKIIVKKLEKMNNKALIRTMKRKDRYKRLHDISKGEI